VGINNRQRRAAKAKRRAKARAQRSTWLGPHGPGCRCGDEAGEPRFTRGERIRTLVELAAAAARHGHDDDLTRAVALLVASDPLLVDHESEGLLLSLLGMLWDNGWQPAEAIRHVTRADARPARLVATAVAADHTRRDDSTLHPRWAAQIESLALPDVPGPTGWLATFAIRERLDRRATIRAVITAVGALGTVGRLPTLIPPPGANRRATTCEPGAGLDDPVLVKVRALLAQAESTTFEAEAAAFTAKAQELMARHAIDTAVLWASSGRDESPTTIRLPLDDPYADVKALLLHSVALHSRCRAVRHVEYGLLSVVGFASDVATTELLFTSLLVQSQAALQAEAAKAAPGSHTRSRSFRSSFLFGFTRRIDQRLAEVNAAVERGAAVDDGSLLPVLATRDSAVDAAVVGMFGALRPDTVRGGSDVAGWVRGKLAADLAQLNFADLEAAAASGRDDPADAGRAELAVGV
jgi:Protein of unknown function (DUF2786)